MRRTITAEAMLARLPRRRRGKNSITPEERTAAVRRVLAGESPDILGAELTRSPYTVRAWVSYYCSGARGHQDLFVRGRAAFTVFEGGAV